MYEACDLTTDIVAMTVGSRVYADTIIISFPSAIENSTIDLPLAVVLTIAGLLKSVAIQRVLRCGFPDGIMPCAFHVVVELIHTKVYSFILGVMQGVVHIDLVQGQSHW
jgi:hypothetical protein